MAKKNLCKNCNNDIGKKDKVCSHCGATVKRRPKAVETIIIVLGVLFFIYVISHISIEENEPTDTTATDGVTTVATETQEQETEPSETETSAPDPAVVEADYKASCETIDYKEMSRYPDNYTDKDMTFRGKVSQVIEPSFLSKTTTYRIAVTEDEYGFWDDYIYLEYEIPDGAPRVLEDDIITVWGKCTGTESYSSVLSGKITIPSFEAKYISIEE